jgi:tetratricopeptide (TPR) repeat protein
MPLDAIAGRCRVFIHKVSENKLASVGVALLILSPLAVRAYPRPFPAGKVAAQMASMAAGIFAIVQFFFDFGRAKKEVETKKPLEKDFSKKVEELFQKGASLFKEKKYDAAMQVCREIIDMEKNILNKELIAKAHVNIGAIHLLTKNNQEAFASFKIAIKIGKSLNDDELLLDIYAAIGESYTVAKKNKFALQTCEQALQSFQIRHAENSIYIAHLHCMIGLCQRNLQEFQKAKNAFEAAFKIARLFDNENATPKTKNLIKTTKQHLQELSFHS